MTKGRFEVSYSESGVEKEIPGLAGKTIASAKVVHKGSEGLLTLRFTDGTVKVYGYNDLAFWEEDFEGKEGRAMQTLKELIEQLPPELQQEVQDFVEFLLEKRAAKLKAEKRGELKLDWRGALRDLRDKYASVELQHKIIEWRIEKELRELQTGE